MSKKKAAASAHKGGRKPRKKKTGENRGRLTPRQQTLLEGIVDGKSVTRAALDAGYSPNTANNPGELLDTARMREALGRLLRPLEDVAMRINEGLDAQVTEFAKFEGRITDKVQCVDFEQRRKYAELNLRLKGLMPGAEFEQGSGPNNLTVNFINVASLQEA